MGFFGILILICIILFIFSDVRVGGVLVFRWVFLCYGGAMCEVYWWGVLFFISLLSFIVVGGFGGLECCWILLKLFWWGIGVLFIFIRWGMEGWFLVMFFN